MKKYLLLFLLSYCYIFTNAQNVTILPSGITPALSGQIQRLSYNAILALPSPQVGDLAIDLTYNCMRFYNGNKWVYFLTSQDLTSTPTSTNKAGGSADDIGMAVANDANGNSFITGYFSGTATFGSTTITSFGGGDAFIAKYNSSGTLQWVRKAGSSTYFDTATAVALDASGNAYITGYFQGTATFEPTNASISSTSSSIDVFIAKYDTNGNLSWVTRGGGTNIDVPNDIVVDNLGNSYITGYFYGTASFGSNLTSAGLSDYFIAKCSNTGTFLSALSGGGTSDDVGRAIIFDGSWIYTAGTFQGTGSFGTNATSNGGTDIFQVKYSTSLAYVRSNFFGGASNDFVNDITLSNFPTLVANVYYPQSLIMTGSFSNYLNIGANALTSIGGTDIFIAKFTPFYDIAWGKNFGSLVNDEGHSVVVDNKGNILLTGFISSDAFFGGKTITSNGNAKDAFFAKFDNEGTCSVANKIASTFDDEGNGIAVDANGNITIVGYFQGTATFNNTSITSYGGKDIFNAWILGN